MIVTDAYGNVTAMNPIAQRLTGWTRDAAQGKPLPEVFPLHNEETRQPVENPVARVLRTGSVAGLANHTVLVTKDGREIPIDDSAAPIRDEPAGSKASYWSFGISPSGGRRKKSCATPKHASARCLSRSTRAFASLSRCRTQQVSRWSFATLKPTRPSRRNPAEATWSGKPSDKCFQGEPQEWIATYTAVLRTGEPRRFERTLVTHGRVLDLYAFRIADGRQPRVAVLFKDITARKQAEEEREQLLVELQRVNAELQQFAHIVSHDLNEPLRAIVSFIALLERTVSGPA